MDELKTKLEEAVKFWKSVSGSADADYCKGVIHGLKFALSQIQKQKEAIGA